MFYYVVKDFGNKKADQEEKRVNIGKKRSLTFKIFTIQGLVYAKIHFHPQNK